jgi:hypothetical protein
VNIRPNLDNAAATEVYLSDRLPRQAFGSNFNSIAWISQALIDDMGVPCIKMKK